MTTVVNHGNCVENKAFENYKLLIIIDKKYSFKQILAVISCMTMSEGNVSGLQNTVAVTQSCNKRFTKNNIE